MCIYIYRYVLNSLQCSMLNAARVGYLLLRYIISLCTYIYMTLKYHTRYLRLFRNSCGSYAIQRYQQEVSLTPLGSRPLRRRESLGLRTRGVSIGANSAWGSVSITFFYCTLQFWFLGHGLGKVYVSSFWNSLGYRGRRQLRAVLIYDC